jgi:hypothetical protein
MPLNCRCTSGELHSVTPLWQPQTQRLLAWYPYFHLLKNSQSINNLDSASEDWGYGFQCTSVKTMCNCMKKVAKMEQIPQILLCRKQSLLMDVYIYIYIYFYIYIYKLLGLSPRANYTDRATAACRPSDCQLLRIQGATWSAWRIPTAVFSVF